MKWIVMDYETASSVDLKKAGAWRYAEDPTTEIVCLGFSVNGEKPELWIPGQPTPAIWTVAVGDGWTFIAHNAAFEKAIYRNIQVPQYGWPPIPNSQFHDTMAVASMKVLPNDLAGACTVLRLPYQKDKEGSAATRALSKPNKRGAYDRSEITLQRVYRYNLADIHATIGLHNRIGWLPRGERNVWLLDQRINERGVRLDLPFIRSCKKIVDHASIPLTHRFKEITGGIGPAQRDKFLGWCREQGTDIPDMRKETVAALLGEEDDDDILSADPDTKPIELPTQVREALHIRSLVGSASIKKLIRMESCVCSDHRARGLLHYHGAGTGRWAGRLLQPQNFPRPTLKDENEKLVAPEILVAAIMSCKIPSELGRPIETVVSSLRHAIVAAPGRSLIAGDFAGIEARIVLALAGQHDKTELLASGQDVYCDMAAAIFNRPIDKEKDPEERQFGKNSVLGLGFQMGWEKFKSKYAKDKTDDFCKAIVQAYREKWAPKVPALWRSLESAALRAVHERKPTEAHGCTYLFEDGWLTCQLHSGRKLWYFNPQPIKKAMPWDEDDIRLAWTYQAKKLGQWKTVDAYGGSLTENVVQALARDIMVAAMFKCEEQNLPIVLTVHDEIVTEPERGDPLALKQIMEDVPAWATGLQIPVSTSVWQGDRYRK